MSTGLASLRSSVELKTMKRMKMSVQLIKRVTGMYLYSSADFNPVHSQAESGRALACSMTLSL